MSTIWPKAWASEVVMGNQIDGQIGSACAVTFGAAFQLTSRRAGELSNFLDMSDDLLAEPLRIRDGLLWVAPGAGLGIDIDTDKLAHYRTDRRWSLPWTAPAELKEQERKEI